MHSTIHLPYKRLQSILPLWLPPYAKEFGSLPLERVKALLIISPSARSRPYHKENNSHIEQKR